MPTSEPGSIYEQNIDKIVSYIESGSSDKQGLGVEFEHILVRRDTYEPVSYSEEDGVQDLLERLSPTYTTRIEEGDDLIGLAKPGETVTLEPTAAVELSAGPFTNIDDAEAAYLDFRSRLDPILDELGIITPELGYHPSARALDLELIPKPRYNGMHRYFLEYGHFGASMMRCSASLQVSIDFRSAEDAIRKLRIADAIAPILALLTDNAPLFEAAVRKNHLVRTWIWENYDPTRPMVAPHTFEDGFSLRDYADYVMNVPGIIRRDDDGEWSYIGTETFAEVYANHVMTDDEVEHAMSMLWPDARLKKFLEIRPADMLPLPYAMAYVALIKGLFYDEQNLDLLERRTKDITEGSIRQMKEALINHGYHAVFEGGITAQQAALSLIELAQRGLDDHDAHRLNLLEELAVSQQTLADRYEGPFPRRRHIPRIAILPRYDLDHTQLQVGLGYIHGIMEAGGLPITLPSTNDPALIEQIVEHYDGFLIPGGQDIDPRCYGSERNDKVGKSCPERDAMELTIIPMIVAADKPILGICRGCQALNVAFGGTLHRDVNDCLEGTHGHSQDAPYDDLPHSVDIVEGSQLESVMHGAHFAVNTIHHQAVKSIGEGLVPNAFSDDGVIEGVERPESTFVIGVQWHPEHLWPSHPEQELLFKALVNAARRFGA